MSLSPDNKNYIKIFPRPYNKELTPYKEKNFPTDLIRKLNYRAPLLTRMSKAILVGDVSVGKTTILKRYCHGIFEQSYRPTIGVDFEIEYFQLLSVPFNLQIWDTAGQERFKCISEAYYRNSNVFDMTKIETLQDAPIWLKTALDANRFQQTPVIFLVGTKSDKLSYTELQNVEKEAGRLAKCLHAEYWSVSAKTGFKIVELFRRIAAVSFDELVRENARNRLETSQDSSVLKISRFEDKSENCFSFC